MKTDFEGDLPNREPQAPRSISIETADRDSRVPDFNQGGQPHGSESTHAGEPSPKRRG